MNCATSELEPALPAGVCFGRLKPEPLPFLLAAHDGPLAIAVKSPLYRPRLVRHRIECYAASAAGESWFCRTAAGVWNPCRSMSQVVL